MCVCVCARACVRMRALTCSMNACSLNLRLTCMSTEHSVSPEPSAYTKSTTCMSTEHSVLGELSALTKLLTGHSVSCHPLISICPMRILFHDRRLHN